MCNYALFILQYTSKAKAIFSEQPLPQSFETKSHAILIGEFCSRLHSWWKILGNKFSFPWHSTSDVGCEENEEVKATRKNEQ